MIERRRKGVDRIPASGKIIVVSEPGSRFAARLDGVLVDRSEVGLCVEVTKPLPLGMAVQVEIPEAKGGTELWSGVVCWLNVSGKGTYRAGIEAQKTGDNQNSAEYEEDHYEVLQVNPKADFDTIHRIYRMLAQRYHPDHAETGDETKFQRLLEAYQTLSDMEKRAAYDVKMSAKRQQTWEVFRDQKENDGTGAERRKRTMTLAVMYRKRLRKPDNPYVQLREVEDVLGIEKEHLEFALWYLREKGFITRTDNGRFCITALGVETYEEIEAGKPEVAQKGIEGDRLHPAM
jgi:curved DNA-binding protein